MGKITLSRVLCLLLLASQASAGFQSTPASVKAEAMGGAFAAMSGETSAAFLNPAGLDGVSKAEAAMMYGKPFAGLEGVNLNQGYLAFGKRLNNNLVLSLNTSLYQAAGMFREYQAGLSGSLRLTPGLALGAGACYLYHKYDISSDPAYSALPVFADGNSRGAVGVNLGALATLNSKFRLGASVRNINKPDVGLQEYDPVPREIRVGGLYSAGHGSFQFELYESDDGLGSSYSRSYLWRLGAEFSLDDLALRAGINTNAFTAGVGVKFGSFIMDYALVVQRAMGASNSGSQYLALSCKIGAGESGHPRSRKINRPKQWAW